MEAAAQSCPVLRAWFNPSPLPSGCRSPAQGLHQGGRSLPLWRPWLPTAEGITRQKEDEMDTAYGGEVMGDDEPSKALALFRHPVRLFWPKSKSFDYLYSEGEKLLKNFPVQATINLYEDSDSEEEEEYGGEEGQVEDMGNQAGEMVLLQGVDACQPCLK
ncbi:PREDICTED: protein ripply1 [Crocodylus porosus]|uniref:protein ripply1 n=1 Tax=Crocodylus porosus TaxID=8502 RepID=UPI00093BB731|nr:PREDICTED: protein ripply1 [Crocodylus porosus]